MEEAQAAPEVQAEVAPVEQDATSQEELTADPVEVNKPEVKPEKTFTQKELDEILQKRLAKESRKIERYSRAEAELQLLKAQMQPRQEPVNHEEPKPEQFKDYESYIKAYTRYEAAEARREIKQQEEYERQQQAQYQHEERLRSNIVKTAEKYDDFKDVVGSIPSQYISLAMRDAIGESDIGGDIAYHLGTNIQEAARIASLTPIGQVKAILDLEAKLKAPKKVKTDAPEPISPSGNRATVSKSPDQMTDKEFAEWRKKHIKAR